jgi:predicted flap endonuclease-1-like 5' DNA nuclease
MGLLTKLKSALGLEREEGSAGSGSDVTVEREASTASGEAVKEPTDGSADSDDGVDEPVASETDAAASTESLVDEEHTEDSTRAAEPAEAAETGGEQTTEPGGEETTETDSEDVSTVKGIGPAYAERLHEAGVETVADLASADAATLAEETDLSEKRVGRWIDSAQSQN